MVASLVVIICVLLLCAAVRYAFKDVDMSGQDELD